LLQGPATGARNEATGGFVNVGARGYCWSSSAFGSDQSHAGILWLLASNVNPLNGGKRAAAFSVRCVQHLRGCVRLSIMQQQFQPGVMEITVPISVASRYSNPLAASSLRGMPSVVYPSLPGS